MPRPLWIHYCNLPVGKLYNIKNLNDQIWIKHYNNITKIFTLREKSKMSKKDFVKYCWNRKDKYITALWNSISIEDKWESQIFLHHQEEIASKKFFFTVNFYINISKLDIFENGNETIIELKIQDYMEDILKIDNQATILYLFALIDFQWNPYFPGLSTIE
jgi:hypothetical protein